MECTTCSDGVQSGFHKYSSLDWKSRKVEIASNSCDLIWNFYCQDLRTLLWALQFRGSSNQVSFSHSNLVSLSDLLTHFFQIINFCCTNLCVLLNWWSGCKCKWTCLSVSTLANIFDAFLHSFLFSPTLCHSSYATDIPSPRSLS